MNVTPLYGALLGLMFFALSVRTLRLRRRLGIAIGDSGNPLMLRAMRVHSNFAEYVPLCLVLLYLVEAQGAGKLLVHALGLALLLGRISHAYGVSQAKEDFRFRVAGMLLTFSVLILSSIALLGFWAGLVHA